MACRAPVHTRMPLSRMPLSRMPRQSMRPVVACRPRASYSTRPESFQLGQIHSIPSVPFSFEKPTLSDVQIALDFVRNRTLVTPELGSGVALTDPLWLPANISLLAWPLFRCFANFERWLVPAVITDADVSFYGMQNSFGQKGLHLFSNEERFKAWMDQTKAPDTPLTIMPTPYNGHRFLSTLSVLPDINFIEIDPGSLRVPVTIPSDYFPLIKRLTMAFQNGSSIRNWKRSKKPATLLHNLGTRSPFFSLIDRSFGQFLRIQDEEALLPIFTDMFYFMKWYDALPPQDRDGLELSASSGLETFTAALSFMDQGWASTIVLDAGTASEHRIPRAEWREMTSLMRNEAQIRAEQQVRRPVPDPAQDEYELGSALQHSAQPRAK